MKAVSQKRSVKKFTLRGVYIVFIIACIVIAVFSFQYYKKLQATIQAESNGYLQEISSRIGSNINRIINDNYAVLHSLASVLEETDADSFDDIQKIIESQQSYWNYKSILFLDQNNKAYNTYGKEVNLTADIYLQNAVINQKQAMSTSQIVDNEEYIVFAIPLDNVTLNGKKISALAATFDPSSFDKVLSMSSFSEQAFSYIISKDGTIIIRSSAPSAFKSGYNVLTTLEGSDLDSSADMAKIRSDIKNNQIGQFGFTLDKVHYYMVYTPVNPEDWYLLSFVPVNVVNAKSNLLLRITILLCAFITLVFAGLLTFIFYVFSKHRNKLEQLAYVDETTEGNTIQRFYDLAQSALEEEERPQYALVYTNLKKFKVLNEQFGRNTCDAMLKAFYKNIQTSLIDRECIGRLAADNFCILLKYDDEASLLTRFTSWFANAEAFIQANHPVWSLPITEFGIYVIENDSITFPQMIDRAKLALQKSSHSINNKLRYAIYDDEVRRQLFREKQLEDIMEEEMRNHAFQVYLQPKYLVANEKIGGAEALTRWISTTEGIIFPDEFIPLFEKNGFIIQLDMWIFEEVCKLQRRWLDAGYGVVKISVNCSREHLKEPDFFNQYRKIYNKYHLPDGLIEIELTESIMMEDTKTLSQIIRDIQSSGIGCSMDDFGSGYSSLNLIKEIPVDTLKLDKIFFRDASADPERSESVISSIVSMAKALKMETVAEGVEHREQVDMLRKIGCDLIQGYVFAKPMPVTAFEELLPPPESTKL